MDQNKKGYYIYSIIAVIIGFGLFGFLGWLIYDLIIKLSDKDFSNNTVIQALITLIITVFIGGYYSKKLEHNNAKKIELYKIRMIISIKIIEYGSKLYYQNDNIEIKQILYAEQKKVILYFNFEVSNLLNEFINLSNRENFEKLVEILRKNVQIS